MTTINKYGMESGGCPIPEIRYRMYVAGKVKDERDI